MPTMTSKTDDQGRVVLPPSFVNCRVILEWNGDEVRVRKAKDRPVRKFSFRELMAGVTSENLPPSFDDGPVGKEAL